MKRAKILIHIGYPKAASTFLQSTLFQSEKGKILNPWSSHLIHNELIEPHELIFDAEACRKKLNLKDVLSQAEANDELIVCSYEGLVGHRYHGVENICIIARRIKEVFGCSAKILILIREQKSMILSLYQQYIREGGVLTIEDFLIDYTFHFSMFPRFRYVTLEYDKLHNYYLELFGGGNVLTLPVEFLKCDPSGFTSTLNQFVGTTCFAAAKLASKKAGNESLSVPIVGIKRFLNMVFAPKTPLNPNPIIPLKSNQRSKSLYFFLDRFLPRAVKSCGLKRQQRKIEFIAEDRFVKSNSVMNQYCPSLEKYGYRLRDQLKQRDQ